nr:MAG TPA: hypothetical protein [Caudoviricetes sp.]
MPMDNKIEMTPYRMGQLMDLSAKLTKTMVSSVWHLSFEEMEFVLDGIRHGIEKGKEERDVSK